MGDEVLTLPGPNNPHRTLGVMEKRNSLIREQNEKNWRFDLSKVDMNDPKALAAANLPPWITVAPKPVVQESAPVEPVAVGTVVEKVFPAYCSNADRFV